MRRRRRVRDRVLKSTEEWEGIANQAIDGAALATGSAGDEFARGVIIVGREGDRVRPRDHTAHPTNGRDQLGRGVLDGHGSSSRVVSRAYGTCPSTPSTPSTPGGVDDRAHGIEDPLRVPRGAQPGAPVG